MIYTPELWLPDRLRERREDERMLRLMGQHQTRRYMPGYPCCCGQCDLFDDDFNRSDSSSIGANWSEESGSWSISSNNLSTSSNNAIAMSVGPKRSSQGVVVTAIVDGSNGLSYKLITNYVDTNNYDYGLITWTSDTTFTIQLYRRSGGSDTEYGTCCDTGDIDAGTNQVFYLCQTDSFTALSTAVWSPGSDPVYHHRQSRDITGTSSTGGVGTGALGGGTAAIDNFWIKAHGLIDGFWCDGCHTCCGNTGHHDDVLPEQVEVDITASVQAYPWGDECGGASECEDLIGTYILDRESSPLATRNSCSYVYEFDAAVCDVDKLVVELYPTNVSAALALWLGYDTNGGSQDLAGTANCFNLSDVVVSGRHCIVKGSGLITDICGITAMVSGV